MKSNLFFLIFIFATVFSSAAATFACSCAGKPTVLDSLEGSDVVMIAKAVSVEMTDEAKNVDIEAGIKKAGYDNSYQFVKSTKLKVEKVYKGSVNVGDEISFGQGGGADCIWTFGVKSVGESFLFYVDKPTTSHPFFNDVEMSKTPLYFAITCGRSQSVGDYETDDLKYLNNLDKVKGKTRISGELNCWSSPCPNLSNVALKIIGENKTYEVKTDEHGTYEIYDLPAGKYLLNLDTPKGWKIDQFMLQYSPAFRESEAAFYGDDLDFSKGIPLNLEAGKHSGIDFYFDLDTAIRGKVLSPDGKPMKDVCLTAVSTELKEGDYRGSSDCTDEKGIFLIDEMPPGKYILVANDDGKISADEPFETLFFPNTNKYADAKPVEVKLGDHLDGFTLQVPKIEELVTIRGKLTYSNGVPIADESLKFSINNAPKNIKGEQNIRTNDDVFFSFKTLKGFGGKLFGDVYFIESMFDGCKEFYNQFGKKNGGRIETASIAIDAAKDVSDLTLAYDFPGCKKIE